MGWEEFAHRHSIHHRVAILASKSCGCFYCGAIFPPERITEWTDVTSDGSGQTALCPECGIDSVIGDRSGTPITGEFLTEMHAYWF